MYTTLISKILRVIYCCSLSICFNGCFLEQNLLPYIFRIELNYVAVKATLIILSLIQLVFAVSFCIFFVLYYLPNCSFI